MTGVGHFSRWSHADAGEFSPERLLPVETATTPRSAGFWPDAIHCTSSGTSRWQCGHQWARNTRSWGVPPPGVIVIGEPSKSDWPVSVGAALPMPGSASGGFGIVGSGVPVTCTGYVCGPAPLSSLPPERVTTTATTAMTTTTAATISATYAPLPERRDGEGGGAGLRGGRGG